jgi:hypothetical protein
MSLTLGGSSLISTSLHQIPELGDWVNSPIRSSAYGVRGTVEITDARHGRPIKIECTYSGYTTLALLEAAIATAEAYIPSKADKTLVVVVGAETLNYYHCTLDRVERMSNPKDGRICAYYDGSGVNKWRHELAFHLWQADSTL